MKVIADSINLSDYLRDESEDASVRIKPASDWEQQVKDHYVLGATDNKSPRPLWEKTANRLQFRSGEVTIWAGINGHFKSMFTSQVMLDLCKQNERVLIVSLEMAPHKTMVRMTRQAAGDDDPAISFIAQFHTWTDGRLWLFDHVGTIKPDTVLALCRYFAKEMKGTQIVIDALMKVVRSEEHIDEQKQFVNDLTSIANETGLHIHLVHHVRKGEKESQRPGKFDLKGSGAISDQADNVIILWKDKAKMQGDDRSEPNYIMCIEKQRNGEFEGPLGFWFCPDSLQFLERGDRQAMRYELT